MTEADAFGFLDPVDHRSTTSACSQTVPQVLARRDHQRRIVILMKGAQADEVRPAALQLNPLRFRQPLHRHLSFQPLDLCFRNPRHMITLSSRLSRFKA
jgi:hypothetical protein